MAHIARRRGPRWLIFAVIASVVVLAVNAAMSARSLAPARDLAQQSYLDQVLPVIQQSTQEGKDIATVRTQALKLGATTMATRSAWPSRARCERRSWR